MPTRFKDSPNLVYAHGGTTGTDLRTETSRYVRSHPNGGCLYGVLDALDHWFDKLAKLHTVF